MNQYSQPTTIEQFTQIVRDMYNNKDGRTPDFKKEFDAAVLYVQPIPPTEGNPQGRNPWAGADVDYLCKFFEQWYDWNPALETGLDKIQEFAWLYYNPAKVPENHGLNFVKNSGFIMTQFFVVLNGQYKMDRPVSKPLADKWMHALGKQMDDYIIPKYGYTTFNEFFIRELKPGKRPVSGVNDDSVVACPADAVVNMIDDKISVDAPINTKTQKNLRLSVRQLLDQSPLADEFEDGTAVSCILMPNVYHRYHSPVSGKVIDAKADVAGDYFGIDDFPKLINGGNVGYGYDYSVFEHFRRGYLIIETDKFGYVAMIPVGLNTIASVIFSNKKLDPAKHELPQEIYKGEEIGYFQYGGSLNILLFQKGVFPAVRIPQGQIIGTMNEKPAKEEEQPHVSQFVI